MNQLNFTPADDYPSLRKQSLALARLVRSLEARNALLSAELDSLRIQAQLNSEVDAERDTNARLTNLLEGGP